MMNITIPFFNWTFRWWIKLDRIKRVVVSIPDKADDAWAFRKPDGLYVRYFINGVAKYIKLPKAKKAIVVSVSRLYNADRTGYNTDRSIIIDLYV